MHENAGDDDEAANCTVGINRDKKAASMPTFNDGPFCIVIRHETGQRLYRTDRSSQQIKETNATNIQIESLSFSICSSLSRFDSENLSAAPNIGRIYLHLFREGTLNVK